LRRYCQTIRATRGGLIAGLTALVVIGYYFV
jgi:hypothetical protein